jgi:biotin carboxyl carrier protein
MHYVAVIGDQERRVEVTELAGGKFRLVMDGREMMVDARQISDTTLSLVSGDDAYNIELEQDPSGNGDNVLVRGHLINVDVMDLRSMLLRKAADVAGGPAGPAQVYAPMPGMVVDVLVEEGQEVAEGQGLLVVEAMKMENELKAPKDGVVKDLKAVKGQTVESGVALCMIEELEGP